MLCKCILIIISSLLVGCYLGVASEAEQGKAEMMPVEISTAQEAGRNKAMETQEAKISAVPENFNSYATEDIGSEQLCVAGTLTDGDGMNQEASLYLLNERDRGVIWGHIVGRAENSFQSRATHCVASANFV